MCSGRLFLPAVTPESGEVKVERLTMSPAWASS